MPELRPPAPCAHHERRSLPPACRDRDSHVFWVPVSRVDLKVIRPKVVDSIDFDVFSAFTDPAVTTQAFATVDFVERAMNCHQKHVEWPQQLGERRPPLFELDDVLHDQVVASRSEHGDAAMETIEKSRS